MKVKHWIMIAVAAVVIYHFNVFGVKDMFKGTDNPAA